MGLSYVAIVFAALSSLPVVHSLGVRGAGTPSLIEALAAKLIIAEDEWVEQAQRVLQAQTKDLDARESVRASCVQIAETAAQGMQWRKKKVVNQLHRACSSAAMEWQPRIDLCNAFSDEVGTMMVNTPKAEDDKVDFSKVCLHLYRTKVMAIAQSRYSRKDMKIGDAKNAEQRDRELVSRSEHELYNVATDKSAKEEALEEEKKKEEEANEAKAASLHKSKERFAEKQGGGHGLADQLADEDQEHKGAQTDVVDDALAPLSSESSEDEMTLLGTSQRQSRPVLLGELPESQA